MIRNRRQLMHNGLLWLAMLFLAIFFAVPLYWMVISSFKSLENVLTLAIKWWPERWHFENYTTVWREQEFARYFRNSLLVSFSVTIGNVFFSSLAGYGLAKYRFYGNQVVFLFILSTMMIPFQVVMIPLYIVVRSFGWLDSFMGLIAPTMVSAFGVFLMRQNMLGLPNELLDAARIDGSSELGIYFRIALPLAKPALATLAIISFLTSWNDLLWPLLVVHTQGLKTISLALAESASGQYGTQYHLLMAAAVVASAPIIAVFLLLHRQYVRGITITGIKG